jgi:hypothetical protein
LHFQHLPVHLLSTSFQVSYFLSSCQVIVFPDTYDV